ncbi:MAG TPA: hypothetical protein DDX39_04315 [Bacteroidales bacterium]|nr:MAG: hypothetical protein A2W98_10685 [Bacteroidetes bacterium GWF2_33_38]OFY85451.1 MAG: hypothetical protein A2236_11550 [Bacteroidetes bacterium RIFOXYA2_FULL_33_7]HBF87847.1 hypothetical protein [Bacteroidales bacterium]
MNYKLTNNITGWIVFIIATAVYFLTIEPTTSFWDCGEFIATAFKLEVGHPPGAPLFMILARFFTLFAGSDVTQVAKMVNVLSALMSSLTILFLFWTITHFAKKMVMRDGTAMSMGKLISVMGAGAVGALAYTFSDSFWFSAVEGEVYAMSSFFTAIVFWVILKWEDNFDELHSNRWIILIAYLMGLSIGVHLLNILAIPAIVFVYYFKKYPVTKKGVIISSIISVVTMLTILYGIIPGIIILAAKFELLFVNVFGLPFNTGVLFYALLIIGLVVWGLYYTHKKQKAVLNTIILAFTVIIIGYSSFTMIVIRSLANPPMDENNPENVFALLSYLNREQYGDRPLIYGQYYNAPLDKEEPYVETDAIYVQKNGRYEIADYKEKPNYDERFMTLFPRMWSSEGSHVDVYEEWGKVKGKKISIIDNQGEAKDVYRPTFVENMRFFFRYQVGFLYFRYFMWNFAGRQDDIQSRGGILNGNWISGIPFFDELRLGSQQSLPESMKSNKGRNIYYMLPLLLGLIGLFYQYRSEGRGFTIVMLLFFLTGLAIIIYLNQTPNQPRERDYAFAGSFYAFAIWIGLGVLAVKDLFRKIMPYAASAILASFLTLLAVPVLMANENWDDHDRSGRYTARDFAQNYLNSCAPNAIIFTNGDNDTFPLWYAQEVEGIRTDVRVVNLSLLNTDWYIDQMKRKAYDSNPVPFSLTPEKYAQGTRDIVYLMDDPRIKDYTPLKQIMDFISSDDPRTKLPQADDLSYSPTRNFRIPVDSTKTIQLGVVKENDASLILPNIDWKLNKGYVLKSELMVLDLLANNNWERPIYFAITVGSESYMKLQEYFQLEGLAYRLVPIKTKNTDGQIGRIDTEIMYDNMINKFKWGGINDPNVYMDENNLRMTMNLRNNFARLADELLKEGKKDSAIVVLDKCLEVMPNNTVPFNYFNLGIAEGYYKAGINEKANGIVEILAKSSQDDLNYYFSLDGDYATSVEFEIKKAMMVMQELVRLTSAYKQEKINKTLSDDFQKLYTIYSSSIQN